MVLLLKTFIQKNSFFMGLALCFFFALSYQPHDSHSLPHKSSHPSLNAQEGLEAFLQSLQPYLLAQLALKLAQGNPAKSKELLLLIHEGMDPSFFVKNIEIWCDHPKLLKRFLDASVNSLSLSTFTQLMAVIAQEPETIKKLTLRSIQNLSDEELINITKVSAKHPRSLKIFAVELDEEVLANFTIQNLKDRKTMATLIRGIQIEIKKEKTSNSSLDFFGVNFYKLSRKILQTLDKDYFQELLFPDNKNRQILIRSLSLLDGIIDIEGEEKINIKGVNRQAMKMIGSPIDVISFIWNIYFGDQASKILIDFRKTLSLADKSDGKSDGIVNLNLLVQKKPKTFTTLHNHALAIIEVSRFQKKLKDPKIILGPIINFIKNHAALAVADTLSPLFIRSVQIRPQMAKAVIQELPPIVIGNLLYHTVSFLEKTIEGKRTLRNLLMTNWMSIPPAQLKKAILEINQFEPRALYDMVTPVILVLSPGGVAQTIRTFLNYPNIFYRYNQVAINGLKPEVMIEIAKALAKEPEEYYSLSWDIINRLPVTEQNAFLWKLFEKKNTSEIIHQLIQSLDKEFLGEIARRFSSHPKLTLQMHQGLPEPLVRQVEKSYQLASLN